MSGIQSDDAWKEQAQREKERLAAEAKVGGEAVKEPAREAAAAKEVPAPAKDTPPAPGKEAAKPAEKKRPPLPPASFGMLLEELLMRAYLSLGLIPHPATGKVEKDLDLARHSIDMLGVIQEKTKGNLSAGEEQALSSALYELRMAYVKVAGK